MIDRIINSERLGLTTLLIIWFVIQLSAFLHFGISTPVDSQFYINSAVLLHSGELPQGQDFMYFSYITLLAGINWLGMAPTNVVILQITASAMSVYCIFMIARFISNNKVAFLATMLFVLWFKYQEWNLIVYTDSLFVSFTIITVYALITARSIKQYLLTIILIVFTVLLRPMGMFFLFATMAYAFFELRQHFKISTANSKWLLVGLIVLMLLVVNNILIEAIDSFFQSYANAEIIYPNITLGIAKPQNLIFTDSGLPPLIKLLLFSGSNPLYMFKISLVKFFLFIGHMKPYYTWQHNVFIATYLYPSYYFAFRGARIMPKNGSWVIMMVFIFLQVLTVSLTSENWDGRFLLPVLPWVFILASIGLTDAFQKMKISSGELRHQP